jgi:hypothetical protein
MAAEVRGLLLSLTGAGQHLRLELVDLQRAAFSSPHGEVVRITQYAKGKRQ